MTPEISLTEKQLAQLLLAPKSEKVMMTLMRALFTPAEREQLALRWQIVKLLNSGLTQRAVAKKLKISIMKVSRGARELYDPKGGFNQILKKIKK
ncbi:MAG: hypothetical protein A2538_02055 [Candidatus Magasanikbacteria bacterium RIFOXYD2_FULL_41_14]|uniref:Transcriptional regulator n=1 Tax=Candidatus Magasanikbacteria bacterium RIFOXYD2_FULL_41_14 TaxID=1798709 RepID=A0A1F6PD21_9BACT|nr:MAG: hypothetical protein A2538_02055 [Candidatus Magasanikbacteria bacterium RIFOXYD2_FULL_41_14]